MSPQQLLSRIRTALIGMRPEDLIDAELAALELREQVEQLPPAAAARLYSSLGEARLLAESAEMLLGLVPGAAGTESAGYTVYGTPASAGTGVVLRA